MRLCKPTFVSFNSLNSCNQTCPMCAVWRQNSNMLTLAEMEPIFRDLKQFGFKVIEISGGEPFLRDDIFEIFAMLDRIGFLYTTATNGTLLTSEVIEKLKMTKGLLQIAVSIDSLNQSTYEHLRGRNFLPVVLQNLEMLLAAKLAFPVKLNLVMNRINYRETVKFLEFAKSKGISLSVFPINQGEGFFHRHSDPQFRATDDELQEMAGIFRELARLRRAGEPLWEYSGFYDLAAEYVLGKPVGPCDAGKMYIDLNADGQVAVCLDHDGVGDIQQTSIKDIWHRLESNQEKIKACNRETPCFYTCTYNISLTARNEFAFLYEAVRVRIRQLLERRTRE
ncbi:MAG: radical SAM protein [Desulfuromonadaceae bacterium]|nr:radical SAM protein [Desulfuromonadaceae bacterium]MDD5107292.1 radical SAM protein [Desulfuromonadaceae bacterium]